MTRHLESVRIIFLLFVEGGNLVESTGIVKLL